MWKIKAKQTPNKTGKKRTKRKKREKPAGRISERENHQTLERVTFFTDRKTERSYATFPR